MSDEELLRIDLIARVEQHAMTATEAAQALGISLRQMRRLIQTFRTKGAKGLCHGNRGRPSPRRLAPQTQERVMELLRGEYRDYNTSQARDELASEHQINLSYTAVYRLRRQAHLASPASHRVPTHRQRRQRAAREGQLLQADASDHDWLEGRGPRLSLIAFIDDATGRIAGAQFREAEDAAGYMQVLWAVCRAYGVPQALYTDRHTIFRSPKEPTVEQRLKGQPPQSQFGRVLRQLGIQHLAAQSPQAKGRVERLFGTLQDRLVKELRRAQAATLSQANQVLARYVPKFNDRFGRPPAEPTSAYRPWPEGLVAEQIFAFQYTRVVANDHTIPFAGLHLPLTPGPGQRHYVRAQVRLYLQVDGQLRVLYQGEELACFRQAPEVPVRADHFVPAEPLVYAPTEVAAPAPTPTPPPPRPPTKPAADHPWRKSYKSS